MMDFEVPGYQIIELQSENPAFKIYRGQRLQDNLPIRLKVLNQPYPTPKNLAPLWQEFEILQSIDLPGVEKAYALENHRKWWMIVLEDSGGRPLSELGIAGRLEPVELLHLALQLVDSLASLHARQIIHKNISPANISCNLSTHQAKLTNFGTASLVSKEMVSLRSPYKLAGSLAHISPEMTGRMSRSVDYRTDYYSFGATLYELLTGTPPFLVETPLELVHAHLALLPDPPVSRIEPWAASPIAFQILSAILLKLLAKNPEDRYQTTGALQADLRQCLSALQESPQKGIESLAFVPGVVDRPVDLNISQQVIGREQETGQLVQAFQRTIGGPVELVLVSGEAGVGKTVLVNQLVRPVTERNGLFLYAKFDQARRQEIYHALNAVLEEFCSQVLSEPTLSFKSWQDRIQAAVSPQGQLLIELCPLLEKVIGPQPPVEAVDEDVARLQLHQLVIRFLQAICRPEHPVVVFLDDLQWTKHDSLLLWQSILSTLTIQNLLVVGAYRDQEPELEEPVQRLADEVRAAQCHVTQLKLINLEWSWIHKLISAALASDPAETSELATLVYLRTEGNPYFSTEFLKSIVKDQLLTYNLEEQKWHWDTSKIEEYDVAGNVVNLFVHEVANLDEDTQKVLQTAACIGRRFDAATLLAVLGQDQASLLAYGLWQAMLEGLIHPLDENYRFLAGESMDGTGWQGSTDNSAEGDDLLPSLSELLEEEILFEFQHDRVQQAVLAMLDEQQLKKTYLQTGWLLLEKAEREGKEALKESLFGIIDRLNTGSALIEDPAEAIKLAQLNLTASSQARAVAAFDAAYSYLSVAMQLLPENCWQDEYPLTIELFTAGAEVGLLTGDLDRAEELALTAEANARGQLEKARLMKIRMDIYMVTTLLDRIFELGLEVIKILGFEMELSEPRVLIPEQAMLLPEMTEPRALAVSRLDELMISAGYAGNDPRLPQVVLFYLDLFSRYGNPPTASYMYVSAAVILQLSHFEEMEQGCRLGRMALDLAEKEAPPKTLYATRYVYYGFVHHWWRPARECIRPLYESFQPAVEAGSVWYSISMQDLAAEVSLFVGNKLEQVRSEQHEAIRRVEYLNNASITQRLRMWSQVVLNLMGKTPDPLEIDGEVFSKGEAQKLIDDGVNFQYMFYLYTARAFLSLLFRDPQRVVESSAMAEAIKSSAQNYLIYTLHLFIYSLGLLSAKLDAGDLAGRLEKVEENLHLMRLWAGLVPENYLHQLELVQAEQARCLGHDEEAAELYARAIQTAKANGYIHESALAAELAAEFYLAQQDIPAAREALLTAYYSYLEWGANAKVDDLVNRYPQWLPPGKEKEKQGSHKPGVESYPLDEIVSSIDLNSILKASLELAQETNLEELLCKLMSILIRNAGAETGSLILWRDGLWYIEIQGSTDPEQDFNRISLTLEDSAAQVPISVIHTVINSKESLLLEDAFASRQFSQDPYIQNQRPKSILCAPLLNQGVLSGVVYLENSLAAGAFTSDRLEIVKLISSQAAVSIEKARLYENLEALVEERTRDLSDTNARLKAEIEERKRVEAALSLSEERYRAVFENTGTAMFVLDEEGNITLANEEFVKLTGYPREALENHFNGLDIIAPSERSRVYQYRQQRFKDPSQAPNNFEVQLVDYSGSEKTVINTATVVPGTRDIIISLIDISQRKQAETARQIAMQELMETEEELRAQNEELTITLEQLAAAQDMVEAERQRYRNLFDFAPDAYLVTNVSGKIFEANHAAGALLGLSEENLIDDLLINFIRKEDRKSFRARLKKMAAGTAPISETSGDQGDYRDWEIRMKKMDGSSFDASITVASVSGNSGKTNSLRWLVRDISDSKRAEHALRESEERLRSITENAPDFIAELDLQGRFLYSNRAALDYQLDEMAALSLYDVIPEEYHAKVRDLIEKAVQSEEKQSDEFKRIMPDGTERWQAIRVAPVLGPFGAERIILIGTDVSGQKLIEARLRASEERFRTALENLLDGFVIFDVLRDDQGRVVDYRFKYLNEVGRQGFQLPEEEYLNRTFLQVLPFFRDNELMEDVGQLIETGQPVMYSNYSIGEFFENLPSDMAVDLQAFRMGNDRIAATWRNVTERVRQQRALRDYDLALQKSAELYRAVVNTQTEMICRYLPDTTLTFVNEAYCRFAGKPAGELIGQSFLISTPEDHHEVIRSIVKRMAENPEITEFEQRMTSASGDLGWQRWIHSPIFENGKVVEFQGVGIDITRRKQAEEALQASEQKFRMLFENSPDAIFLTNAQGSILSANPAACAMFGYSEQEFTNLDRYAPFDMNDPRLAAALEERQKVGRVQGWELTAIRKNGEKITVEGDSVVLPLEITRSIVILHDITERKKIEQLLRDNEARLSMAMDSAQLAPFEYNLLTGKMIFDERIGKILSGIPEGEPLDYADILMHIHPEDRWRADQAFARALESGSPSDFEQELRVLWPDGSVQWVSVKGKLTIDGEVGQRLTGRLAGILRDITRQKVAEEDLRYNEALLRKVLEVLPVGIWITDTNHKIISGNPESLRIWGGAKYVDINGYGEYKAWRLDTGKSVKPEEWAGALAITKKEITLNEELEIEAFDGTRRIILNSAMPIEIDEGTLAGAIIVNQDITLRKRDEKALQRAHDQLSTLLDISQTILSTLDLDILLNLTIEQLAKVLPYEGAAILTLEENSLKFQVIRGPSIFHGLNQLQIPANEPLLVESLVRERQPFYIQDLLTEADLLAKIQDTIRIPFQQFTFLRTWLGLPLIAKDVMVGMLVLAHSQPDFYSADAQILAQAYANQVAVAIHNAQLYQRAHDIAALEERNRIARELHDSVAQALYSISLFTDATRMALDAKKMEVVNNHLDDLVELSREAMSDMRMLIFELRPPVVEKDGLLAALQSRLDSVEARAGFQTQFDVVGDLDLSAEEEGELYRIAQEALNNVLKHARANRVIVQLAAESGCFRMTIQDNGVGFDLEKAEGAGGQGIRNIRERSVQIGAVCRIESAPGEGTKITIEMNK